MKSSPSFRTRTAALTCLASAAALLVLNAGASAASIQFIGGNFVTDFSQDGSVAAGNTSGAFETFRWTQATGVVPLGRATVPVLGTGAGSPDISWDGTKISATILSDSGTQATWGKWTQGTGWQQLAPFPANSTPSNANVGSAWGLSGDGNKLVGLYWINGGGRAQAAQGTVAAGVTSVGTPTLSSRASATNYDGSVVVGFEAATGGFPSRTPTVWANGVTTKLEPTPLVDCELSSVSADGTIVAGNFREGIATTRDATIWRFTSGAWVRQGLGSLPGTALDQPGSIVLELTADGSVAVGLNRFDNSSQFNTAGIYWSESTGLISANQLLTNLGLSLPANTNVVEFDAISPDGSTIAGATFNTLTGQVQGFIINNVPEPASLTVLGVLIPLVAGRRQRRA